MSAFLISPFPDSIPKICVNLRNLWIALPLRGLCVRCLPRRSLVRRLVVRFPFYFLYAGTSGIAVATALWAVQTRKD